MDPIVGSAAIAAAGSLAGGLFQQSQSIKAAREQMAFQRYMSSTAYQRAVKDMRLAGINPMLAYMQGGASSPGGAMADIPDVVGPAVSSALHARRLVEELRNMKWSRELMELQGSKLVADKNLAVEQQARTAQETREGIARTKLINAQVPFAENMARVERSKLGKDLAIPQKIRELIFGKAPLFRF